MKNSIQFAHLFSNNMTLQQGVAIPVWGTSKPNSVIRVEFNGVVRDVVAPDGSWRVSFPPVSFGGPFSMTASCEGEWVSLKNIMVGDVWLAGGQSNMNYPLLYTRNGMHEIHAANLPDIRLYTVPKIAYEAEGEHEPEKYPGWQVCSPDTALPFSAVAFYFIKNLYSVLGIPMGVVNCSWDGTSASCWMSRERLAGSPDIRVYMDEYMELVMKQDPHQYIKQRKEYAESVRAREKWVKSLPFVPENMEAYFRAQEAYPFPWPPPMGPLCELRPAGLYYTMLKKIIPFPVRGVIWYQGEGDVSKPSLYEKLFSEMIANWREEWKAPSMPFLFAQISSFGSGDGESWPLLREQQLSASHHISNTAMTVTIDCGDRTNVHPIDKKPVGERLALLARSVVYHEDIECSGPVFQRLEVAEGNVVLSFSHAGGGLMAKGGSLRGFDVCDSDSTVFQTSAKIYGNKVVLRCDEVKTPVSVRYGWSNYTDANLVNSFGLPASPFRTLYIG